MILLISMSIAMRMCWANWALFAVVVVLSLSSLLSACGKTGDLYLPDEDTAKQQTP